MTTSRVTVGVDACPVGWFATVIDTDGARMNTFETFETILSAYPEADRILVDIPIGLPEDERRRCDQEAKEMLGCRGFSVFYPPCRTAAEINDYQEANAEHSERIGYGLSQQAHSISPKILEVNDMVEHGYDGVVRESHPEICFAALNHQPVAYPKSSDRGLRLRMSLLSDVLDDAKKHYQSAREEYFLKEVRRDDILDSMVLAVTARDGATNTVPVDPSAGEPRIYHPGVNVPAIDLE